MTNVHLIGIGGSGMSAIARLLIEKGFSVSGSDLELTSLASEMQKIGAKISIGHHADNVKDADFVIRSSAIPVENIEVQEALRWDIPVYKRADYIGQLVAEKIGIAVAGTHGKTTTTAMISWMLTFLNKDPSFLIGGVAKDLGVNAHKGMGDLFVVEADEYDYMFLGLTPQIAVVTNVEHDHPDLYPTKEDYFSAFNKFVSRIPEGGELIACQDDDGAAKLLEFAKKQEMKHESYGINPTRGSQLPDYFGDNLLMDQRGNYRFDVYFNHKQLVSIDLNIPGIHNVRNALASICVAHQLDLPLSLAAEALRRFQGTGRRFELRGVVSGITVVDDYAHHPTEIRATLAAAHDRYPDRQLWAVWQPHTYSRTQTLFQQYLTAFDAADHVLITEIFASREPVEKNFSAIRLVEAMHHPDVHFMASNNQAAKFLKTNLKKGDVLMVLSAGDATQISTDVLNFFSENGNENHDENLD